MKRLLKTLVAVALFAVPAQARAQFISVATSVTDNGAPTGFAITFGKPIDERFGLVSYSFDGFLKLQDATGDGVSATPPVSSSFFVLEVGNGTTNAVVDIVGGTSMLVGAGQYDFSANGVFDCATLGSCTFLTVTIGFLASGEGDLIQGQGTFALGPAVVPEPATFGLVFLGIAGLTLVGGARRRRA